AARVCLGSSAPGNRSSAPLLERWSAVRLAYGCRMRTRAGEVARTVSLYGASAIRLVGRRRGAERRPERADELIFVVGAPRSGTTFLATSLGAHPALVDLGEVQPLKAAIPWLAALPTA